MNTDPKQIELVAAALAAAQGELKAAEIDSKNPFLRNRYASLGSVIAASRQALLKHGLAMMQTPSTTADSVSVTTAIIHKSGQWLDGGTMYLPIAEEKGKSRAQVLGSIITYLRRYAWASVLGIYAGDDDDGNGSQSHQDDPGNDFPASTAAEYLPPDPTLPKSKLAPDQMRMKVLNDLQAHPGQPNRTLVTDFLRAQGWIQGTDEPESWPIEHVPNTPRLVRKLGAKIAFWEKESKTP